MSDPLDDLVQRLARGERRAVARTLRRIDDDPQFGRALALRLTPHIRGAQIIGITGNPGAGKSTLVDVLIAALREEGRRVAVLAVDPSSPYSGGAILGDRIRMSRHAVDDGVFIRSLATRGALGGISRATAESVRVLDVAGFDTILIETVGVGQDEVDIARLAETTVVIMVPGLGDDLQAIKAGLLEVADIFVINKADRPGVHEVERALQHNLSLAPNHSSWPPPIVRTVALTGEGLAELISAIGEHRAYARSHAGRDAAVARARALFEQLLDAALVERGRAALGTSLDAANRRLTEADVDPYAEVARVLNTLAPCGPTS